MRFLPENYQAPKNHNRYMKLQDGENKIRILSQPILGWEDWIEKKPMRYRMDEKPMAPHDPKKPVKHFWAFIVWNYLEEKIQILHVTQASIRNRIESLCKDEDWGDPYFYDIKIIRKGEGIDTEYEINPLPHRDLNPRILNEFEDTPCYLEVIFENGDPFAADLQNRTPSALGQKKENSSESCITDEQKNQLKEIFSQCEPDYYNQLIKKLKDSSAKIDSLDKLPAHLYERIKAAAENNKQTYFRKQMGVDEMMEVAS